MLRPYLCRANDLRQQQRAAQAGGAGAAAAAAAQAAPAASQDQQPQQQAARTPSAGRPHVINLNQLLATILRSSLGAGRAPGGDVRGESGQRRSSSDGGSSGDDDEDVDEDMPDAGAGALFMHALRSLTSDDGAGFLPMLFGMCPTPSFGGLVVRAEFFFIVSNPRAPWV